MEQDTPDKIIELKESELDKIDQQSVILEEKTLHAKILGQHTRNLFRATMLLAVAVLLQVFVEVVKIYYCGFGD